MEILVVLFLFFFIFLPVAADENFIQINPVGNHHLGERFTISGSVTSTETHRLMITLFPKSCWDSFTEFVTMTGDTSIYTAESTPYMSYGGEYSYTNPDGSVTEFGRPQCPSESYNIIPSLTISHGKIVWNCSINGTMGDPGMKPGLYVIRVIDPDSGKYCTTVFSLEKKVVPVIHPKNHKYSVNFMERALLKESPVPRDTIGPVKVIAG